MQSLPILPRRSWLDRLTLGLAIGLVAIGGLTLAGWWLQIDELVQPRIRVAVVKANAALCFLGLGQALLAREFGRRFGYVGALVAAIVGGLSLVQDIFHLDLHIDQFLVRDHLMVGTGFPGRMPALEAGCLVLCGLLLAWGTVGRTTCSRLLAEGMIGSIVAAVGLSILFGYLVDLPVVYSWGSGPAIAPVAAVALCTLGATLVMAAWRESQKADGVPPKWAPMPAVFGGLCLTGVLWIGLLARESTFSASATLMVNERLAVQIKEDFDKQAAQIERLARAWGDMSDFSASVWEADARRQLYEFGSENLGCRSIGFLGKNGRLQWIYPQQNLAPSSSAEDAESAARKAAMDAAEKSRAPAISETVHLLGAAGKFTTGFVIYSPIIRRGDLAGFVAAEYEYQKFFPAVASAPSIANSFAHLSIAVSGSTVCSLGPILNTRDTVEKTHVIASRRVRITIAPTVTTLDRNRRNLPEIALLAGLAITFFLGTAVYFTRVAILRAVRRDAERPPGGDATRLIARESPAIEGSAAQAGPRSTGSQANWAPVFGGRYRFVQEVGRGGMGVVWRAEDTKLNRTVALKLLSDLVVRDQEAMVDLAAETRRCLELTHPNIVRVYDLVEEGERAAISMEFVDGPSLADHKLVQPGRCFEPESLVKWLGQLCSALDYAHRAVHLVHRDLKPLNLLLTSVGGLKVVDFGISRSLGKAETRLSTRARSSGFSLAYAGPQQIMGEPPAVTDDIYSFGATVYELLTGKTPFYDGDLLSQIREVVPPSIADRRVSLGVNARREISAAWESTIAACLSKKAADRPQSAVELAERLGIALP